MPSSCSRASILPLIANSPLTHTRQLTQRDCVVAALPAMTNPSSRHCERGEVISTQRQQPSGNESLVATILSSVPRNRRIRCLAPGLMRNLRSLILSLMLLPGAAGAATLGEAQIAFTADRLLVIDGRSYRGKIWTM